MIVVVAPSARRRRSGGGRQALVAVAQVRLMILSLLFGFGMLVVIGKLALLALWAEPATARDIAAALVPVRGDIVDRNGAPLARSIDAWSIAIHPDKVIADKGELAQKLAALIPDQPASRYYALLNAGGSFAYLKRRAMPELVDAVNALGEPAIEFQREPDRLYPQSGMAAHVLGYLDDQGRGVSGMEKVLEPRLADPAQRGQPVALSIDARVQAAMESELGNAMTAFQAQGAAGVMLDVATGEIVAMVSLPSFNPNAIAGIPPRNNVTQSVYELGSTFKPLAVAAGLETGVVTSMSRRFDATKSLQVGRFKINDDPGDEQFRWLNIPETLIYSSNIATARIADEIGAERLQAMYRKLGFDTRPAIETDGARPLWPSSWGRITVMTTAYGHGIAVTPLHLANAYAAMVNGGILRPTTLLKVEPGKAAAGVRVMSEATSARMRQLLRLIVLRGTGRKGEAIGYRIGGKTGTAEAASGGGYDKHRNVSTFAAAFPIDAPRYVVIAMLDSPKGNAQSFGLTTAAWTVAPVVSRLVNRTGAMLGVRPDTVRDIDVSDLTPMIWEGPKPKKGAE
ncbi:peptidoglycan D,D-transpeptidase FtsI family protein [Sphingomonas hengshuiensis]|uniref:Peptidoglycan glycosyltransferase n=1 Tax=Sphingomonas hengshuiensis TaxID=1609977 RepID=A0A7U4J876_9SPHN|nr:penicillin-binding protein 2 [Sphingomonas hengshuiensis]AJP72060.1 peptidoglycan glycosyltransferase [Sphingomonas hengshuiensis]